MELSLSKLPWYGQIGAFVAVSGLAVFGFWKFYVSDAAGRHQRAADATRRRCAPTSPRASPTARRLPEFQSQVAELERRLENLRAVLPEQKDVADILRRVQGLATQSNLTIQRFTPQPPIAGNAVRGASIQAQSRGHVSQPRVLLRSHQQVPAHHQRGRHRRSRRRQPPGAERDASRRSASRRRSCCRSRQRPRDERAGRTARSEAAGSEMSDQTDAASSARWPSVVSPWRCSSRPCRRSSPRSPARRRLTAPHGRPAPPR